VVLGHQHEFLVGQLKPNKLRLFATIPYQSNLIIGAVIPAYVL